MWFKRKQQNTNRRKHRNHVLDVKLRSDQVRANRVRLTMISTLVVAGPLLAIYLLWRAGEAALNVFVYENADFAIQQIDAQTDGVIAPEQLRRWAGVKPGANLIGLDLAAVKRNLELVSVIDSVSLERVLPRTLKIRVTERTPIAQVNLPRTDGANGIPIEHQRLFLGILHTAVQLKRTAEQRERHIHQLEEQLEMKDEIIEIKDRILVSKESVIESQLTQLAKLRRYLRARGQH